jgi:hypothetical protein
MTNITSSSRTGNSGAFSKTQKLDNNAFDNYE